MPKTNGDSFTESARWEGWQEARESMAVRSFCLLMWLSRCSFLTVKLLVRTQERCSPDGSSLDVTAEQWRTTPESARSLWSFFCSQTAVLTCSLSSPTSSSDVFLHQDLHLFSIFLQSSSALRPSVIFLFTCSATAWRNWWLLIVGPRWEKSECLGSFEVTWPFLLMAVNKPWPSQENLGQGYLRALGFPYFARFCFSFFHPRIA